MSTSVPSAGRSSPRSSPASCSATRQSYLRQDPDWTPTYGTDDDFTFADLLRAAGVVATMP